MNLSPQLRWVAVVVWVPAGFALGLLVAGPLGEYLVFWDQYVAAVLCPVLVIGGTWKIAPAGQRIACVGAYALMLIVWWKFLSPVPFPEGFPAAGELTHRPFYTTVIVSFFCLVGLLSLPHDYGDLRSHPGVGGPEAWDPETHLPKDRDDDR